MPPSTRGCVWTRWCPPSLSCPAPYAARPYWYDSACFDFRVSMVAVLNVAEKPSAAKALAEILSGGRGQSRTGRSKYNRIFEFPYRVRGTQCEMSVTSVTGHLMGHEFRDEAHRGWGRCDPVSLFDAPLVKRVSPGAKDVARNLVELARRAEWLILWLDCDREGENIAFEVRQACLEANPRLMVFRARFSALVFSDLSRALEHLEAPNERASEAVDTRAEIDLRIGAAYTRFLTLSVGNRFAGALPPNNADGTSTLLSYGSCQFPTLGFVVRRYWEVQDFSPEPFWAIRFSLAGGAGAGRGGGGAIKAADFEWERGRLFDRGCAEALFGMCAREGELAEVLAVDGRETRHWAPLPLNTVDMQKRISIKLRIGSDRVMQVAEKLYQEGYISYPRTETNVFEDSYDLKQFVRLQAEEDAPWSSYARGLLGAGEEGGESEDAGAGPRFRQPRAGKDNDKAHPPIHPTKFARGLSGQEASVYEFIVRHFLACVSPDAIGHQTKVTCELSGERFSTTGVMISALNWYEVYRYYKWNVRDIPVFSVGQQLPPRGLQLAEGATRAPPLLSEADLIALMDKEGIGTDATMAQHIKNIQDRGYATLNSQRQFSPTPFGLAFVSAFEAMGYDLHLPRLRAAIERGVQAICDGQSTKATVLRDALSYMEDVYRGAQGKARIMEDVFREFFGEPQGGPRGAGPTGGGGGGGGGTGSVARGRGGDPTWGLDDEVDNGDGFGLAVAPPDGALGGGSGYSTGSGPPVPQGASIGRGTAQQGYNQGGRCNRCGQAGHSTSLCPQAGSWTSTRPSPLGMESAGRGSGSGVVAQVSSFGSAPPLLYTSAPAPSYASAPIPSYASVPAPSSSFNAAFYNQAPSLQPTPAAAGGPAPSGGSCYRCGGTDHWARDCTQPEAGGGGSSSRGGGGGRGGGVVAHGATLDRTAAAAGAVEGAHPVCPCNGQPFQRKTSQSSKNPGRDFYKCTACDAFHWVDAYIEGGSAAGGGGIPSAAGAGGGYGASGSSFGPGAPSSGSGAGGGCFRCGGDHWARDCTRPPDFSGDQGPSARGNRSGGRGRRGGRGGWRGGRSAKRPRRGGH